MMFEGYNPNQQRCYGPRVRGQTFAERYGWVQGQQLLWGSSMQTLNRQHYDCDHRLPARSTHEEVDLWEGRRATIRYDDAKWWQAKQGKRLAWPVRGVRRDNMLQSAYSGSSNVGNKVTGENVTEKVTGNKLTVKGHRGETDITLTNI